MPNELPEGMVTLLFTDLEGSTANANAMGEEAAQDVRRRHFELVREQVGSSAKKQVRDRGDQEDGRTDRSRTEHARCFDAVAEEQERRRVPAVDGGRLVVEGCRRGSRGLS
ncbi:MAG: hypothetical protein R3B97_06685 [Dehalococcoidia bacterium]